LTTNSSLSKPKLVEEGNEKWCEIKKKGNDIIQKEIRILLNTPIPLQTIGVSMNSSRRKSSQPSNLVSTSLSSSIFKEYEIRPNASAQKASYEKIKIARNKITEFESLYNIASNTSIRSDLA
ncbi:12998_t:CDS:1, partial [Gigaspora rosea]